MSIRSLSPYHLYKSGKLTIEHGPELIQCFQINSRYCWDTHKLRQRSNLADSTQNTDWFNELRIREEVLELTGRAQTL
ncbi:DUF7667 family protein [Paenibacillus auburnensis]|uniref:DUF7667 family protein n=1 Tax=Paenibacillus auburnensis TaxID=2905649 RepID=UPI003C6EA081